MEKESGAVLKVLLAISTMESTKTIASMVSVASSGRVETNTRVSTSKMIGTVMEKCAGLMALGTKANGIEAFNTDMAR